VSFATPLIGFGLRQVLGDGGDDILQLAEVVQQRFTDHGAALHKTLEHAHDRAWQVLGVALSGDGLLDRIRVFVASSKDKRLREQVQLFMKGNAVSLAGAPAEFRIACLDELRRLRKGASASATRFSPEEVAQEASGFRRPADPQALAEEACRAVAGVADALAGDYPNLSNLLHKPTPSGPPLLAAAFCYFFLRAVETDEERAPGLFLDGLRQLTPAQAEAFAAVGRALAVLGGRFDAVLDPLGHIKEVVVETQETAAAAHGSVLEVQAELQRLGGMGLASVETVRLLLLQVLHRLHEAGMQRGEVRPKHAFSIRSEDERQAVRALLASFRELPVEEQRQTPALLNGLGKLQVGAGQFADAHRIFTEVVQVMDAPSGKAEAWYNAYRAALEGKRWDAALEAVRQAAALDPLRFAPFPTQRYQPQRILGAGGFGVVHLCQDALFPGREVVVKALHAADLDRRPEEVFAEAHVLSDVKHPAVIGVLDWGYVDPAALSRPYIVMPYFPGVSLQQLVHQRGALSPEQLVAVARQVAAGMREAHARGVWHLDLKPDNVLVSDAGDGWQVRIIDFGLARRKPDAERTSGGETVPRRGVAGTVDYASPEQLGRLPGVEVGPHSDVYAFGKTCCHVLFHTTEPRSRHLRGVSAELVGHLLWMWA